MKQAQTLSDLARARGLELGDKILFRHADEDITYAEFDKRVDAVASALVAKGIRPGQRIGFLGKNHPSYFELLFGAGRAGIVMVPLNWRLAPDELAWIAGDAELALLVAQKSFADLLSANGVDLPETIVLEEGYAAWRDGASVLDSTDASGPDDVAVQLYTSGTTGRPKGAQITNRNLLYYRTMPRELQPEWNRFEPEDVGLLVMPIFHIGGTGFGTQIIGAGASALVANEFDADFVMDAIANQGLSKIFMVPTALRMLIDHPKARSTDYSRIRTLLYGASPIPLDLLRDAMQLFECGFVQMYGMTETTGTICVLPKEDHDPAGNERMLSAGKPLDWVEIAIRDAEGNDLPVSESGEIYVRGPTVMAGYWKRPDANADDMTPDGWFKTGDAGYLDTDGYLFLRDRVKDMIVTGGENVYPAEVERVLQEHPDIAEVAVIGTPDAKWGEKVTAIVVPTSADHASAEEIVASARSRLAGYKLPKEILFIDSMPRNSTGKILRRELRSQFAGTDKLGED